MIPAGKQYSKCKNNLKIQQNQTNYTDKHKLLVNKPKYWHELKINTKRDRYDYQKWHNIKTIPKQDDSAFTHYKPQIY